MTRGGLILLGLLVLVSPLWKIVLGETALTAGAENRRMEPTPPMTEFRNSHPTAIQCGSCHSEQFKDWSSSFHAQSLTSAGFVRSFPQYLEFIGNQPEADPQAAMACFSCHAPLLKHAGPEIIRQVSDWVRNKDITRLEGFEVGCVACHTDGNGAFSGPIRDPKDNPFHVANFSPAYKDASFCAPCHTAKPASIPCSDVYTDWEKSDAGQQGKTCQSCHMPERSGIAGAGGPVRKIRGHSFPGGRSAVQLQQAVKLGLKAAFRENRLEVTASVRNLVPHRVPDG